MSKFNSEFNYRYQVIGETVWEKIKTLLGFLDGRQQAAAMEEVSMLKMQALEEKLQYLKDTNAPAYEITEHLAIMKEAEASIESSKKNFRDNEEEIVILNKLLKELYDIAEPTRLSHEDGTPYSDEEMFEVNAANEFTVWLAREMQAEIISNGRPSPAKIKNAMSNPVTWLALKDIGFIPNETKYIAGNVDPSFVTLLPTDFPKVNISEEEMKLAFAQKEAIEQEKAIERKKVSFS